MTDEQRAALLERLMTDHGTYIKRLCAILLSDRALAEDASQDVFVKAWGALDGFRGESNTKTRLTRIAVNTCRDYQRTGWFRRVSSSGLAVELPERILPAETPDDTVFRAVLSLSPPLRTAIFLRYYEEMTFRDIAEVMHTSVSTVHRRMKRAQAQLTRSLKGWYFT